MARPDTPECLDPADLHLIDRGRDGADLILPQQYPEHIGELLRLHHARAQHLIHLLHRADQDIVELARLLRRLRLTSLLQLCRLRIDPIRKRDPVEEFIEPPEHLPHVLRRAPASFQLRQRRDRRRAPLLQLFQLRAAPVVPRRAVACRMHRPALLPLCAVDVPGIGVALQPVAGVLLQRAEARFEERQHRFVVVAFHRLHRSQQRRKDRFPQDLIIAREIRRKPRTRKKRPQRRLIDRAVSIGHGKLTAAAAAFQKPPDAPKRKFAFLFRRSRLMQPKPRSGVFDWLRLHGKKPFEPAAKLRRALRRRLRPARLHRDVPSRRLLFEPAQRLACRTENGLSASVRGQRKHHLRRPPQQLRKDLTLHRRKIRKAVEIENMLRGEIRLLQERLRPLKPRDRILPSAFADRQIAFIQDRQLLQLLRELPAHTAGRLPQRLRRKAAAQKLLHRRAEALQELRLRAHSGIILELWAYLLRRQIDAEQPSALVQIFLADAAVDGKQAACQPREAQHLGVPADRAAARAAERTLRRMGILLRHDQDLARSALPGAGADAPDERLRRAQPIRVQHDPQHIATSPCILDACAARPSRPPQAFVSL